MNPALTTVADVAMDMPNITPHKYWTERQQGHLRKLLDVRTAVEFRSLHAEGAELRPIDSLDPAELLSPGTVRRDEPVAVICASGGRSAVAARHLLQMGFTDVVNIEGGTTAWEKAGLPVVRGRPSMSLERQVRISAGLLVCIGLAFGWFLTPWMLLLPAFIGAGLIFSGLSDTCGMGSVLLRMPWNR